jgi:hypothetical protein
MPDEGLLSSFTLEASERTAQAAANPANVTAQTLAADAHTNAGAAATRVFNKSITRYHDAAQEAHHEAVSANHASEDKALGTGWLHLGQLTSDELQQYKSAAKAFAKAASLAEKNNLLYDAKQLKLLEAYYTK